MSQDIAAIQLACIAEVSRLLSDTGLSHWLMGGWGLDFLAGRVTRAHDDVDFFVFGQDVAAIHALLVDNGYTHKPASHPDESAYFSKGGQWVDMTLLEGQNGDPRESKESEEPNKPDQYLVVPGRFRHWPLPAVFFAKQVVRFQAIACPVLDVAGQLHLKTQFQRQSGGAAPRPKDIQDMALLRQLLEGPGTSPAKTTPEGHS